MATLVFDGHEPSAGRSPPRRAIARDSLVRPWARSSAGAPISVEGRLWGVMIVASRERDGLAAGVEHELADFTELVATAIANAQARAELMASRTRLVASADETRRKIERDLHDGAQQQFVSVAMQLRTVKASVPPDQAKSGPTTSTGSSPGFRMRSTICASSHAASTRRSSRRPGLGLRCGRSRAAPVFPSGSK